MNKILVSAFALTAAAGFGVAEVRAESVAPGGPVELNVTQLDGIKAGQRRIRLRNVRQDASVSADVSIDGNRNTVTIAAVNVIAIEQNNNTTNNNPPRGTTD